MKLTLGGVEYHSDLMALYRVSINEARIIKRQTGMTLADWRFSLVTYFREDPDMLAALVWLLKRRAGEVADWDEIDRIGAQDVIDGAVFEEADAQELARIQGENASSEAAADDGEIATPVGPDSTGQEGADPTT